jgi:hypothetical protein
MKFSVLFILSLLSVQAFSQNSHNNVFSYYFKSAATQYKSIDNFSENQFGEYKLMEGKSSIFNNYELRMEAGENLIIDETGVFVLKNRILSISRTEIRENSKYSISNGYLHGVLKNDSLAVALQDELFYFLMPAKAYLYETTNSDQAFVEISNGSYLVLTKENNTYYSTLKIDISTNQIMFSELDLSYDDTKSTSHEAIAENGIETFILSPTQNQWDLILTHFVTIDSYSKN